MKKLLFALPIILLLSAQPSYADPEDFVFYDLSLAGYRLGMSFDDANALRPILETGYMKDGSFLKSHIRQVYIDDIPVDLDLKFKDENLFMVVARVGVESIDDVRRRLTDSLGEGEDHSKVITNFEGVQVHQKVSKWTFPHAQMLFVWTSSNKGFATLSLLLKNDALKKLATDEAS